MKGMVFTEFLDFVAQRHGDDMVEAAPLASGGARMSVGAPDHCEIVAPSGVLSEGLIIGAALWRRGALAGAAGRGQRRRGDALRGRREANIPGLPLTVTDAAARR